jgi:hypothetical protein
VLLNIVRAFTRLDYYASIAFSTVGWDIFGEWSKAILTALIPILANELRIFLANWRKARKQRKKETQDWLHDMKDATKDVEQRHVKENGKATEVE